MRVGSQPQKHWHGQTQFSSSWPGFNPKPQSSGPPQLQSMSIPRTGVVKLKLAGPRRPNPQCSSWSHFWKVEEAGDGTRELVKTMRTTDRVMVPNTTCIGIEKPSVYAVAGLQSALAESQPLRSLTTTSHQLDLHKCTTSLSLHRRSEVGMPSRTQTPAWELIMFLKAERGRGWYQGAREDNEDKR